LTGLAQKYKEVLYPKGGWVRTVISRKVKVSIVGGGGVVGSTAAYRIAHDGLASEIVLVDVNRNLAEAHALDIDQAVAYRGATRIYAGDIKDTKNSDLILVTVTGPRPPSLSSRSELLPTNLPLIIELMEPLLVQSPSAIWFLTTAPVDPLVYLVHRIFSIPRHKVIGLNWNDSSRFCWAIARILSVPCSTIEAFVIGEHGETQVPLFSLIRIHGEKISLDPDQKDRIRSEIEPLNRSEVSLKASFAATGRYGFVPLLSKVSMAYRK